MRIAVYCSSRTDIDLQYIQSAEAVGTWIGSHSATMVYGGMNFGLMKVVASAVKVSGGKVIGVVPISIKSGMNPENDETIFACDLNDRKAKIMMLSDVFVVLPGGYGSLDEFITTFAFLSFTSDSSKKIILLNQNNIYDNILQQMQVMIDNAMMDPALLQRIKIAVSAEECCVLLRECLK
jgi:uncharacterized protein (TIGR00730 family)